MKDKFLKNQPTKEDRVFNYYKAAKNKPPKPLLVKALTYLTKKEKAIDIGSGALVEANYLLEQGFDVVTVDKVDPEKKGIEIVKSPRLHSFVSTFDDFDFPKNEYDIASAMYALPFNPPESFNMVFNRIKNSLVKDGIFCGQFFGVCDEWSSIQSMTFHKEEEIKELLSGMEIISLKEVEQDSITVLGLSKHCHLYHVIARKL